jgi:nucleoside-diphosphate-sugar epimerase
MTKCLITGGAGAIGSRLAADLASRGFYVCVLDDLSSGSSDLLDPGVTFVRGSITDAPLVSRLLGEAYDYVFHLAALFANQNSVDHPLDDLETNGQGTLQLLESIAQSSVRGRLKRLVYASSSCVYGGVGGAIAEDAPFHPDTPYAITKLLGEQYVRYYSERYELPAVTLRLFNSYGPGEMPGKYRNVIPNFIKAALLGEPLSITGSGNETRDFTYVDDVVGGFWKAATAPQAIGRTYNIGTGRETPIRVLAETILSMTASDSELRIQPRRAWDHVSRRRAVIDKAREELGYEPSATLEKGIQATISWIRSRLSA